jgi:hypothetical protein
MQFVHHGKIVERDRRLAAALPGFVGDKEIVEQRGEIPLGSA